MQALYLSITKSACKRTWNSIDSYQVLAAPSFRSLYSGAAHATQALPLAGQLLLELHLSLQLPQLLPLPLRLVIACERRERPAMCPGPCIKDMRQLQASNSLQQHTDSL